MSKNLKKIIKKNAILMNAIKLSQGLDEGLVLGIILFQFFLVFVFSWLVHVCYVSFFATFFAFFVSVPSNQTLLVHRNFCFFCETSLPCVIHQNQTSKSRLPFQLADLLSLFIIKYVLKGQTTLAEICWALKIVRNH